MVQGIEIQQKTVYSKLKINQHHDESERKLNKDIKRKHIASA